MATSPVISTLIDELLFEQQQLTAVERFSQKFGTMTEPALARHYRELIPLNRPAEGEQYAFEVDLDACSGCKACVSACHSLNGLDETEAWRDVGSLVGSGSEASVQQTVTTACHHCADPACANGCPTLAYEKDEQTGIVRHLDDQCMGCRYCELKCPYEVPKYNERLGIVRKCDMCQSRLAEGEAPACVQACPNEAIRITIVRKEEIQDRSSSSDRLLPGTVSSDYTLPATVFHNLRTEGNLEPAGTGSAHAAHGHFPLAWMLALTQVGAGLVVGEWFRLFFGHEAVHAWTLIVAIAVSFCGLAGSIFHLGRPSQAWRAFLGWRKSWLSREIIVFGPWAGAMLMFALSVISEAPPLFSILSGAAASLLGVAGVFCSVMVYADTRRPFWSLPLVALRFMGSMASAIFLFSPFPWLTLILRLPNLLLDLSLRNGWLKTFPTSTSLLQGPLRKPFQVRVWAELLVTGALLGNSIGFAIALAGMLVVELVSRSIFFQAVDEPGMPGVAKT